MLREIRHNYHYGSLDESQLEPHPIEQFDRWMVEALGHGLHEPHGMTLCTVSPEGRPSSRVVLLRDFDQRGFVFFTNYQSRKGQQLSTNPYACLSFWWPSMERQVRIEGQIAKAEPEVSDSYFASRPRGSQVGSSASPQSQVIASRAILEARIAQLEAQFPEGQPVPRPEHWGGYRLKPDYLEFWQGRPSRLHDRLCYTLQPEGSWRIERLAP